MKRKLIWAGALGILTLGCIGCGSSTDTGFQEPPKAAANPSGAQPLVSGAETQPQGDPSSAGAAFGGGKR